MSTHLVPVGEPDTELPNLDDFSFGKGAIFVEVPAHHRKVGCEGAELVELWHSTRRKSLSGTGHAANLRGARGKGAAGFGNEPVLC